MRRPKTPMPFQFKLFVVAVGAGNVLLWYLLAKPLGALLALALTAAVHIGSLVCALRVSARLPRLHGAPTYTLHERIVPYRGSCPRFEERAAFPDWARALEQNSALIADEFAQALATLEAKHGRGTQNADYKPGQGKWVIDRNSGLVTKQKAWQHLELSACPRTMAMLEAIPGFRGECSFSKLSAHARITMHSGETDMYYRCHLGLRIPGGLPGAGFHVGGEERAWEEGKLLIFCDGYPHSAWNDYDEERVILLFSVLRPEFIQHEPKFHDIYKRLLYLKTGITGSRDAPVWRPVFAWLTALKVVYVNSVGHL